MDLTHNTCTGRKVTENVYLYTVLAQSLVTGKGVPLAFLLTNVETNSPSSPSSSIYDSKTCFNPTSS